MSASIEIMDPVARGREMTGRTGPAVAGLSAAMQKHDERTVCRPPLITDDFYTVGRAVEAARTGERFQISGHRQKTPPNSPSEPPAHQPTGNDAH